MCSTNTFIKKHINIIYLPTLPLKKINEFSSTFERNKNNFQFSFTSARGLRNIELLAAIKTREKKKKNVNSNGKCGIAFTKIKYLY